MSDSPKLLKPELVALDKIQPYEKNAKLHPQTQVEKLAASITKHGFDQPIVVDKNYVVIKGHGRRLACLHLGLKRVPVIVRDDLSDEEVRAARLADNRVVSADYDTELLQVELSELMEADYDMESIGFDERELKFLTDSLDDLEEDSLVMDVGEAFDEAKEEAEQDVETQKQSEVPIAQALGFKTIPRDVEKTIQRWVSQLEESSGKTGLDALMDKVRSDLELA